MHVLSKGTYAFAQTIRCKVKYDKTISSVYIATKPYLVKPLSPLRTVASASAGCVQS